MSERHEPPEQADEARHHSSGRVAAAVVLILVGVVFLVQNFIDFSLDNWWALFILIPAFAALSSAWRSYKAAGRRLTQAAAGPLTGGSVLVVIAVIFLFGLDLGDWWPVLLIIAGIGLFLGWRERA